MNHLFDRSLLFNLCLLIALPFSPAPAQDASDQFEQLVQKESLRYRTLMARSAARTDAGEGIDVTSYAIKLDVRGVPGSLEGQVTIGAIVDAPSITTVALDLSDQLVVDSVLVNGTRATITRTGLLMDIVLPRTFTQGESVSIETVYHGTPGTSGFGSYTDIIRPDGNRWIFTLSEPYGARDWWPGVDHPTDKADSVDVWLSVPAGYQGISIGRLVETVPNGDGSLTFKWEHRYPVTTYLISVNVGKFDTFSDWYVYSPTDSMEVVNYIQPDLPTRYPAHRTNAAKVPRMLEVFSEVFGPYPFIKERYGQIEFGWGGGMEHQTLTSLGAFAFNEGTIAHELAHQWFGDMITCRTWPELWLNEGFATWCDAFFREREYGYQEYMTALRGRAAAARNAFGSLYVQDTTNVGNLFSSGRVYSKGAWVLHMLRGVLGDSLFFEGMRSYATDPQLMYGTAATVDLRRNFESVTGSDLGYFFDQWVFGERFPTYVYRLSTSETVGGFTATVRLRQSTGTTNPEFFTMPVEFRFYGDGLDTTITVWNDSADQTFDVMLPFRPDSVRVDPNDRILKVVVRESTGVLADLGVPDQLVLAQNYPNPFNAGTVFRFGVPVASRVTIEIVDMTGRLVAAMEVGDVGAGFAEFPWQPIASSGTYFYRVIARPTGGAGHQMIRSGKLVLLK